MRVYQCQRVGERAKDRTKQCAFFMVKTCRVDHFLFVHWFGVFRSHGGVQEPVLGVVDQLINGHKSVSLAVRKTSGSYKTHHKQFIYYQIKSCTLNMDSYDKIANVHVAKYFLPQMKFGNATIPTQPA